MTTLCTLCRCTSHQWAG